jgi:hypothetical protein
MKAPDHALAITKAALNLVPGVGGAIASLIGDYVPMSTQRSIERGVILLGERLQSLEDRIDPEVVNKDEFAELFKSCYLVIVRTHQEEKLQAATAILANLMLRHGDPEKASYEELDHLIRCVDTLSIGAIAFLGMVRKLTKPQSNNRIDFGQVSAHFIQMGDSLLMSLATELDSLNLLHTVEPGIRTENYGNYALELSPIGIRFVDRFLQSAEQS